MSASDDRGNESSALSLVPDGYTPSQPDAVQTLENRFDAHSRDTASTLAIIAAAVARIEKRLENNSLGFEDVNARIDRIEINELETRRQLALLQKPSKKVKRK